MEENVEIAFLHTDRKSIIRDSGRTVPMRYRVQMFTLFACAARDRLKSAQMRMCTWRRQKKDFPVYHLTTFSRDFGEDDGMFIQHDLNVYCKKGKTIARLQSPEFINNELED